MTFHIFHNPMQSLDFSGAGGSDTESHPSIEDELNHYTSSPIPQGRQQI
jgi:hypothetical protein